MKPLVTLMIAGLTMAAVPVIAQDRFDSMEPGYGAPLASETWSDSEASGSDLQIVTPTDAQRAAYDAWFSKNEARHLAQHAELVTFRSLAMVPEEIPEVHSAGAWLVDAMSAIGVENAAYHADALLATGEIITDPDQPTVLFYGHFDVQPVNAENWDTDPWVATEIDGKIYGRGSTDNKGMIIAVLSTIEALKAADGSLPVNVKLLWDGSEEFGSQGMPGWLAENADWVRGADYGISVDAMMASDDQGLMWRGLRGGAEVIVRLTGANTDLHSGIYGGAAPNTAIAASKIIASMFNDDGSIAVEGFDDGTTALTQSVRSEIAGVAAEVDLEAILNSLGLTTWIGDPLFTPIERTWVRGSIDITGLKSEFTEGAASIVPSTAWFRVFARTGPGQDPAAVNEAIMAHIEANTPWGINVEMTSATAGAAPFFNETDLSFRIGQRVLTDFFGREPLILYVGGGIAALSYVPEAGGPQLVSFGFQRSDEGFHADNEYMRLSSFRSAQRAYADLLFAFRGRPLRN